MRGSVASGDKKCFFSPQRADWLRNPPSLLHDRCQGFFPGRKAAEGEIDRARTSIIIIIIIIYFRGWKRKDMYIGSLIHFQVVERDSTYTRYFRDRDLNLQKKS